MAAEDKLQNVKAIRQMLDGTHKSQTRKIHGYSDTESMALKNKKHEVGDVWEEKIGNTLYRIEQKDGFRVKQPANSVREEVKDILTAPDKCPCCGTPMKGVAEEKLNLKFYFMHGKCFSCVLKEETLIRSKGKEAWEEYSRKKMLANAKSWMKDADKEVDILKEKVTETYWQNADGEIGEIDITSFVEKMDDDYKKVKNQIISNLEKTDGK
jgi:hypothetical protein